jgi:hypothetical protein
MDATQAAEAVTEVRMEPTSTCREALAGVAATMR